MFIDSLKKEIANEKQLTEKGAIGYRSTGKDLLNMNFRVSSYRNMSDDFIFGDFMKAYNEDPIMAMRWLFYARDPRGGLGERRLFRVILNGLQAEDPETAKKIVGIIPLFGRWDDLFSLVDTSLEDLAFDFVLLQWQEDVMNYINNKPISLLSKWMPSINCSNKERRRIAGKLIKRFNMNQRIYRQTLSELRSYIDVVEKKMSAKQWEDINYSFVPSRANFVYNKAFFKHDEERRAQYLEDVKAGKKKINSDTNFPHEILHKYSNAKQLDTTVEELWKALPDYGNLTNTLVVADGSGSMQSHVGNSQLSALEVANSLAIYFAEHCSGRFKNHYITFSSRPQLVNLGDGSLFAKKKIAERYNEVANTNIEAVFKLILQTAINQKMDQWELPNTILIISDMEFDSCTSSGGFYSFLRGEDEKFNSPTKTLFENLAEEYERYGYSLPKLAFWNVMSRTMTIPVKENEAGVSLISGFSPLAIKMVLSGKADPYEALLNIIKDEKYDIVEKVMMEEIPSE